MKQFFGLIILFSTVCNGQSLNHPHIWTSLSERQVVLDKINADSDQKWSAKLYKDLHVSIDAKVDTHFSDPSVYLTTLPDLDKNANTRNDHSEALFNAVQAGFLYFLDQDEKYAQFASDILSHYTLQIAQETGDLYFSKTGHWIESRDLYPKVGMIYDFIQPFLVQDGTTIYNTKNSQREEFDLDKAQLAFKKLADEVFYRGNVGSNHPMLEASGALFNLLVLKDDSTRNAYFDRFMNGTPNQDGLHLMLQTIKDNDFLWPESTSYGKETHEVALHMLHIAHRYDPSLDLVNSNRKVLKGAFLYENLKYPNYEAMIRYGDSRRTKHTHFENLYLRVLEIAESNNLNTYKNLAIERMQGVYNNEQKFEPVIENEGLEWDNPCMLFWGVNIDFEANSETVHYHRSAKYPHVGVGVLRNYETNDIELYGLMGYIGGAHYVHSHLTGIEMELYGSGIVLGAGSGDPKASSTRGSEVYRNYHRIYANKNTVIVNGESHGAHDGMSWKWDNIVYQNKSEIRAIEPDVNMDQTNSDGPFIPVSENFSFVTVELEDEINNALQQRTFSIIRTSPTTGYYLDVFRSKSNNQNKYHDYLYHNFGERLSLKANNQEITKSLEESNQTRYSSTITTIESRTKSDTAVIDFPGWQYFEKLKISDSTNLAITGKFDVDKIDAAMYVNIPEGINREYTRCIAPPILETESDYKAEQSDPADNDSAQVLVIRQYGEAWERPFVVTYEPSKVKPSVKSMEHLYTNNKVVGAKIISEVNGREVVDFVISQDVSSANFNLPNEAIDFTGRFGIVRKYKDSEGLDSLVAMYIGDGSQMICDGKELNPESGTAAYSENVSTIVSRKNRTLGGLSFYPNPTSEAIKFTKTINQVDIYNHIGQLVFSGKSLNRIDVSLFEKGVYTVVINKTEGEELIVK